MSQAIGSNNADAVVALSPRDEPVAKKLDFTIDRAQRALLAQQHPEGYWQGALEVNAEMNAEYIIFNRFMELPPDPELDRKTGEANPRRSREMVRGRCSRAARATYRPRSKLISG
jgi:hypothetical protein